MSGNPSPPPPRTGGGGTPDDDDCGRLRFQTQLASPVASVVNVLSVGAVLTIELQERSGVRVIVAVSDSGDVAGSVVDRIHQLLRCLQSGYSYRAVVVRVLGGAVGVTVEPAT